MTARKLTRALSLSLAMLITVGLLALPASSLGTTVDRFSVTFPVEPIVVSDTCAGLGVEGTLTGTLTISGRTVDTAPAHPGFHFAGSFTLVYRVDFADGSYLVASQREPQTFNDNPLAGQTTFGGTLLEMGTLYDASGTVIGYERFNSRFRTTIVDGTAVVEIDEGFLSCR